MQEDCVLLISLIRDPIRDSEISAKKPWLNTNAEPHRISRSTDYGVFSQFRQRSVKVAMADEKKIIVDEDWKTQVEAEREQAATAKSAPAPPAASEDSPDGTDPPMPPASFEMLLTTLATEALLALGQMPHPITGKVEVKRNQAKFLIDTVDVLRQKTAGNLNNTEQQVIDSLLHQMRLMFVQTADAPAN
jgi:hypothetical protein